MTLGYRVLATELLDQVTVDLLEPFRPGRFAIG
jgi:hypothetical protein